MKRSSPVVARHFELAIVVVSGLNRCRYCVSHHAPLAAAPGLSPSQVEVVERLDLRPLPESHDFPPRPGFTREDNLVIDLALLPGVERGACSRRSRGGWAGCCRACHPLD
jgi:AhpD family alkylhydroperoxidase